MFCWIGKVVVVNNSGIIHFGFAKQIAPDYIQVGSGNGSTTSEDALEQTGRETENQANGNGGNNGKNGNNGNNGNSGNSGNNGNSGKVTNGKSKGNSNSKSKGKATGKAPAAAKKTASPASTPAAPNLPLGKLPFSKNHPLYALLKKGFK